MAVTLIEELLSLNLLFTCVYLCLIRIGVRKMTLGPAAP